MATEREKEREAELESAMYTNCLLLGIDPAVIGGGGGGTPRVGHFRHSNPRMGEHLLHFFLSALRGPAQSAKDFDKVWPIFDSGQSRDFRKIVQGIISELESQGALQRSNSRVSSLATCCGPRFVELLWQLSVHALREVHRQTFDADVASNPLPASLTDISYLHAAALLPITKARIAIERRKFLKNADIAVRRQTTWSNLAHEMTAEFRGLCAEEAYLQQELEKVQDMRNKANLEGELWDDRVSSSSSQNIHLVSKATRLWESVLARKSQHEALASGPIEDLIAHREHRYRISGSSLLAATDSSSHVPYSNVIYGCDGEMNSPIYNREQTEPGILGSNETLSRADGGSGSVQPTVDIAEILRRWTHALQRIHKQSLQLAKANDGEGPELLRCASDSGNGGHAESLATTLAEHRHHLVSIQGLINQLKEAVPAMQKSIEDLTEEVNIISPVTMDEYTERSTSSTQAHSSGRLANSTNEVLDATSKFSVYLNNASTGPALKLPHLFSLTPSLLGKGMQMPQQEATVTQSTQTKSLKAEKFVDPPFSNDNSSCAAKDSDDYYVANVRRSVREAALSRPSTNCNLSEDKSSGDESEHFFIPLLSTRLPLRKEIDAIPNRRKQRLASPSNIRSFKGSIHPSNNDRHLRSVENALNHSNGHLENTHLVNELQPTVDLDHVDFGGQRTSYVVDESLDQMFSSPLLMDSSLFLDTYDDLLAPLSEIDAALMEMNQVGTYCNVTMYRSDA